MSETIKNVSEPKKGKKTFRQFIVFFLLSIVTTVVDLGTFSLFNYLIFTGLKTIDFQWWLFNYSVINGGLCAFLSFSISFVISQTFNFFIQRKVTFGANNNVLYSGLMYAVMVLLVFFFQLWIPTLLHEPLANLVGSNWGDFIIKNFNMTISFLIQFPMNKWVIMRQKKAKPTGEPLEKTQ
jgi:putative flippase GtrA